LAGLGVRTIIVETANRFARDLMVQEVGHARLKEQGIELIAADNPSNFIDDTPTAVLVRQVLGAIAQFDKAMTVSKLRGARERTRRETDEQFPEAVTMAKRLRRASPDRRTHEPTQNQCRAGHGRPRQ
jgi:DNA invertase Pin-like site-specific DNA recombinase